MSEDFNFIAIKNLDSSLLLKVLIEEIAINKKTVDNIYVSILPPIDDLYLIEFADFIPITRFRDINIIKYLNPLAKSFEFVYFFFYDKQMNKGRYQKYFKGSLEEDFKGSDALERGLTNNLFMDKKFLSNHFKQYWDQFYKKGNMILPEVYQLVKDTKILEQAVLLKAADFYG